MTEYVLVPRDTLRIEAERLRYRATETCGFGPTQTDAGAQMVATAETLERFAAAPVRATGGELRERIDACERWARQDDHIGESHEARQHREIARLLAALSPAIAPAGFQKIGTITGTYSAKYSQALLPIADAPPGTELYIRAAPAIAPAGGVPYGWIEPETGNFVDHTTKLAMPFDASTFTLAVYTALPAAGNAVDDAMVERAAKAYCDWFTTVKSNGINTLALRAALTAALYAAPQDGEADQPVGDALAVVERYARKVFLPNQGMGGEDLQQAADTLRQQLAATIAERDRAVKDAERYRWLNKQQSILVYHDDRRDHLITGSRMDTWIDAAIAAAAGDAGGS